MSCSKELFLYETTATEYNVDNTADPNDSDNVSIEKEDDISFSCTVCFKEFPELIKLQRHYIVHIVNKPYPCTVCEKSFFTESALQKHAKLHQDDTFYHCELCESTVVGTSSYKAHLDAHYFPDFTCNACFQSFPTKVLLQQHERTHTTAQDVGIVTYRCMLCDYYFNLQRDLEDHMEGHEKVRPHTCKKCDKEFFYSYMLNKHWGKHHFRVVCNVCGESFPERPRLHEHEQLHLEFRMDENNILRFACEICSVMFPLKSELEAHYDESHDGHDRFPCTMCYESFFFSYMLRKHKMTHTEMNCLPCDQCKKIFKSKLLLNSHKKTVHAKAKEFKCSQCGKAFCEKYRLKLHCLIHTGLKPYVCSFCSLAFRSKPNLDRHYLTHTDTKRYKCVQCDSRFSRTTGLKHHMKQHGAANELIDCPICGKRFISQMQYRQHTRKEHHTSKNFNPKAPIMYTCEYCGKKTRHYSDHQIHVRQHTGERPFRCIYCERTFVQRTHLLLHHKFHHPELELVIELPFKCAYCKHSCLQIGGLRKHHGRVHRGLEFKPQKSGETDVACSMVELCKKDVRN